MKFRDREPEPLDINLTPLIDVVFLLLIFFMVSTTFERASELAIELPRSSAPVEAKDEVLVEVSIDGQGRFYVNGRQLINTQLDSVRSALSQAVGERTDVPVVLSADANSPYQSVITVMDAARKLGLTRLRFPTSPQVQP